MLQYHVTWGKIIALFTIAGALAVDCIQQGHTELVISVVNTFEHITSHHLAKWIVRQGGWVRQSVNLTLIFAESSVILHGAFRLLASTQQTNLMNNYQI